MTFLWGKFSEFNITLDIQGYWRPIKRTTWYVFLRDTFIDKGYHLKNIEVLNNVRIYMKVIVLNDITKNEGTKMVRRAINSETNMEYKWAWSPHRNPTSQNKKVWSFLEEHLVQVLLIYCIHLVVLNGHFAAQYLTQSLTMEK